MLTKDMFEIERDNRLLAVEHIAETVHEANRAYCLAQGDLSQPSWEGCTDDVRAGTLDGVMFHLDNPEATADASHENWMEHKTQEGWTHGETKSEADKTHPSLVPFKDLPEKERLRTTCLSV